MPRKSLVAPTALGSAFLSRLLRRAFTCLCPIVLASALTPSLVAQDLTTEELRAFGLHELQGKHLRLITDLPLDDEVKQLPAAFDAAIPIWLDYFPKTEIAATDLHATAMLIVDRARFEQAKLIPSSIPDFKEGYHANGNLYLYEQSSPYFRRHLLLHEGTHWLMWRLFGSAGPTWYMEGMAEMLGTHQWQNGVLRMGVIPAKASEFPYWGRIKIVRDQLEANASPSLDEIFRRPGSPRAPLENYAWNWAAVRFLLEHRQHGAAMRAFIESQLPNRDPDRLNRDFFKHFEKAWPTLRTEWNGFVSDLEYGYDFERACPDATGETLGWQSDSVNCDVEANRGWQWSHLRVKAGESLTLSAEGSCWVQGEEDEVLVEPQGVSLQYVHHFPWGELLATVGPFDEDEPPHSSYWQPVAIGRLREWTSPRDGLLFLKVNDYPSQLADNRGSYQVTIRKKASP